MKHQHLEKKILEAESWDTRSHLNRGHTFPTEHSVVLEDHVDQEGISEESNQDDHQMMEKHDFQRRLLHGLECEIMESLGHILYL